MRSSEFSNDLRWLGSDPIKIKDLRGKAVVLIDFWAYSSASCIRSLSRVKLWHRKYSDAGLVVVGVHAPEFEFEKNIENVARMTKELGIEYPVAMDNDYQTWSLYSNSVRPHKFLINKDGQIIYNYAGEGNYEETEEAIRRALLELNPKLKLPEIQARAATVEVAANQGGACLPTTQEIYLGSMRGSTRLTAAGRRILDYRGFWKVFPEYIEHERKSDNFEDCIVLNFEATEVNLVMEATGGASVKLRLELNGKYFKDIDVFDAKMYSIVNSSDFTRDHGSTSLTTSAKSATKRELRIYSRDVGLRLYAFSFGACA